MVFQLRLFAHVLLTGA